ncbi:RnfABCDGE type electron transport complex subunit D [Acidobacteriota bacterium]
MISSRMMVETQKSKDNKKISSFFMIQKPMLRVCGVLVPLLLVSVYLFGWRTMVLTSVVLVFALLTEAAFTLPQGKPVSSAALVTGLIFSLSLPPGLPMAMAVIGIIFGIALGKMVFGGFGRNIFNPAMVGRCFIYITFPVQMTSGWIIPQVKGLGGFVSWSTSLNAITGATPLAELKQGLTPDWPALLLGNVGGSLGETSAVLIILGGLYLIYKKTAPWRLALSCLIGGAFSSTLLHFSGIQSIPSPLYTLLAGSFLFGTFFVVTEPVSGAKTQPGQWIYGFLIGALIVILRGFSNFAEGVMFSVLIMNAFAPLLDDIIRGFNSLKKNRS